MILVSDTNEKSNVCYYVNKHLNIKYDHKFVVNTLMGTKINQIYTWSIRSLDSNRRDEIR